MARIVAVTPTLADAVMSAGGTLARHAADGHEVIVVTVFEPEERTAERAQVSELLGLGGIVSVALPAADARGYDDAEHARYGGRRDEDDADAAAGGALAVAIEVLRPEVVLAPLGLTGHVDDSIIASALAALSVPALRWFDLPYGLTRTPGAPLGAGDIVAVPVAAHLTAKLSACQALAPSYASRIIEHAISEGERLGTDEPVELLLSPERSPRTEEGGQRPPS